MLVVRPFETDREMTRHYKRVGEGGGKKEELSSSNEEEEEGEEDGRESLPLEPMSREKKQGKQSSFFRLLGQERTKIK